MSKRFSRYRPPPRPRKPLSTIYGADGEVIYEGDNPAEASRIWADMLRASLPEQFGKAKKKRKPRYRQRRQRC